VPAKAASDWLGRACGGSVRCRLLSRGRSYGFILAARGRHFKTIAAILRARVRRAIARTSRTARSFRSARSNERPLTIER
jgi:hypothetical protein